MCDFCRKGTACLVFSAKKRFWKLTVLANCYASLSHSVLAYQVDLWPSLLSYFSIRLTCLLHTSRFAVSRINNEQQSLHRRYPNKRKLMKLFGLLLRYLVNRRTVALISSLIILGGNIEQNPVPCSNFCKPSLLSVLKPFDLLSIYKRADGQCLFHVIQLSLQYQHNVTIFILDIVNGVRIEPLSNFNIYIYGIWVSLSQ